MLLEANQKTKVKLFMRQAEEVHKVHKTLSLPHFQDERLTLVGQIISLMRRTPFIRRNNLSINSVGS
jgi:hypothetical protein